MGSKGVDGGGGNLGAVADLRARAEAGDGAGADIHSRCEKPRSWTPHALRPECARALPSATARPDFGLDGVEATTFS